MTDVFVLKEAVKDQERLPEGEEVLLLENVRVKVQHHAGEGVPGGFGPKVDVLITDFAPDGSGFSNRTETIPEGGGFGTVLQGKAVVFTHYTTEVRIRRERG